MALCFEDSNKIGMEQASKQAGVSMIMVEGVVHPEQQQLLCGVQNQILKKKLRNLKRERQKKRAKPNY